MGSSAGRRLHPNSVRQQWRGLSAPPTHPGTHPPALGTVLPHRSRVPSSSGGVSDFFFGANWDMGFFFLLRSRNKDVASTEPNGDSFFYGVGSSRLSGSVGANNNAFPSCGVLWLRWCVSLELVTAHPWWGDTPRARPSRGAQSSSSEVPGCDLPPATSRTPAPLCEVSYSFASS